MSISFREYLKFNTIDGRFPNFTMVWKDGGWGLKTELRRDEPEHADNIEHPYKFVGKTDTRFDRMVKLLAAIEGAHPDDARLLLAHSLHTLFRDPAAVGKPSIIDDKKWRAGNAIRPSLYSMREARAGQLWRKLGTAAEEEIRAELLYSIFNSLSPDHRVLILAGFMRLV